MSITLELRGKQSDSWALSSTVLSQIERLRRTEARSLVNTIFGDEHHDAGTARTVNVQLLVQAVQQLQPVAKRLPRGFEVLVPPLFGNTAPVTAPGIAGAIIEGRHHYIRCLDDYWTMQPTEKLGMCHEPPRRYEPAEIQSENMGVIKVQVRKGRDSGLGKLLLEMSKFLKKESRNNVAVIWG